MNINILYKNFSDFIYKKGDDKNETIKTNKHNLHNFIYDRNHSHLDRNEK